MGTTAAADIMKSNTNIPNQTSTTTTTVSTSNINLNSNHKKRCANVAADGYDLRSMILSQISPTTSNSTTATISNSSSSIMNKGEEFTEEEVFGHYLDLYSIHHDMIVNCNILNSMFINTTNINMNSKSNTIAIAAATIATNTAITTK